MKNLFTVCFCLAIIAAFTSCRKTSFIESPDALVTTSTDTLHFDTVFTTTGSVTQAFKIFNQNNQKLRISNIKLMGGITSAFKINVDGTAGTDFTDIEMEPDDSLYVFVSVSINPNVSTLAYIVRDSISINYNGKQTFVQLDAFGQNANFYRNRRITKDTTWNNALPFVILSSVTVDSNVTLTINKGCKIYSHANAPFIVNGTLKVNGEKYDSTRITFSGDRLDAYYRDFPGSWPGIFFTSSSKDNVLNYAIIKNAYQGIITQLPPSNTNAKVTLNECIIDNIYDAGILSLASTLNARNCLISNCGANIAIGAGGVYNFTNCTVASYGNYYLAHKNPVLYVSNANGPSQTIALLAVFRNCIFYGEGGIVDDEIILDKKGTTPFNATFENVLYKVKNDQTAGTFNAGSIKNLKPEFDTIDISNRNFNFRLKASSPAVNKGVNAGVTTDLDGKPRNIPDIGCYEF